MHYYLLLSFKNVLLQNSNCCFYNTDMSQGNVATHLRCGSEIFSDSGIANFFLILTAKDFGKKVGIYKVKVNKIRCQFFSGPLCRCPAQSANAQHGYRRKYIIQLLTGKHHRQNENIYEQTNDC